MSGTSLLRASAPDWSQGSMEFRRGWVAASRGLEHEVADGWHHASIGPLDVRVHPALGWASARHGELEVLVLGDPVDLEARTTDTSAIAASISRTLVLGRDAVVRQVAFLGGRFTCVVWDGSEVVVIPDCVASLPLYWHESGGRIVLSSFAHLVGELVGAAVNTAVKQLMARAKEMKTPGTLYWPGIETPFLDVLPVLPNHLLRVTRRGAEHERFYPFADTTLLTSADEAYEAFRQTFELHTRLLCGLGRTGISLTAGVDSRTTLKAARGHLGRDSLSWTYYNFDRPHKGMQADLLAANRLAGEYSLEHRIVAIETSQDAAFDAAYARSFKHTPQFRALAHAYHDQIPHDVVELQSMVAEVGTGFYKRREGPPTVERLTALYSSSEFGALPEVRQAMERYVQYARFEPGALGDLDYHDLFYWETRIGRWGTLRMQEVDLSHRLVLPFNARAVVEALQAPPLQDRVAKQALLRYLED